MRNMPSDWPPQYYRVPQHADDASVDGSHTRTHLHSAYLQEWFISSTNCHLLPPILGSEELDAVDVVDQPLGPGLLIKFEGLRPSLEQGQDRRLRQPRGPLLVLVELEGVVALLRRLETAGSSSCSAQPFSTCACPSWTDAAATWFAGSVLRCTLIRSSHIFLQPAWPMASVVLSCCPGAETTSRAALPVDSIKRVSNDCEAKHGRRPKKDGQTRT